MRFGGKEMVAVNRGAVYRVLFYSEIHSEMDRYLGITLIGK